MIPTHANGNKYDVVIVGAGSGGIAAAASLRKRNRNLNIALIDPSEDHYKQLIVTPGLKLNWAGVEGLEETLGKNGVTSNYRYRG